MELIAEMNPITLWLGTVFPAVLAMVALILLICAAFDLLKVQRLRRWPAANGVVIASEVIKPHKSGFKPWITYRFEAAGRSCQSNYFFHGQQHLGYKKPKAEALIADFCPGTPVTVRYDPDDPHNSVVVIRSIARYYIVGALSFSAAGAVFAAIAWTVYFLTRC